MSSVDIKKLGQRLKAIRKDLGMAQVDVAKAIGVSQSMVSKVERGAAVLSPVIIGYLLLFADRININYLLSEHFDINQKDTLYHVEYSLNSIVRAKMETLQQDLNKELDSIKELL